MYIYIYIYMYYPRCSFSPAVDDKPNKIYLIIIEQLRVVKVAEGALAHQRRDVSNSLGNSPPSLRV